MKRFSETFFIGSLLGLCLFRPYRLVVTPHFFPAVRALLIFCHNIGAMGRWAVFFAPEAYINRIKQ